MDWLVVWMGSLVGSLDAVGGLLVGWVRFFVGCWLIGWFDWLDWLEVGGWLHLLIGVYGWVLEVVGWFAC